MRILFTFIGGSGHFRPLIPVARAAQAAGHTVAFAGAGGRGPEIAAAGFTAFATSEPRRRAEAAEAAEPAERRTVEPPDPEADVRHLAEGFARRGARRHASAVLERARAWKPDVLVRDEVDFGTAIAAESLAIPRATVLVLAAGGFLRREVVAEPLHELRSAYGLRPDPELAMLERHLVLSPFPPGFRDPRFPLPAHTFSFRPTAVGTAPRTPTVYFTLGTVNNTTDLFTRVLDPVTVTSEEVRTSVSAVLADVAYRSAAERVGEEINALPGPEQTIPLLEALH
ncbi:hypothetical protein [Streptomyces sp. AC154]|uniref:hypothetical protein n=1 Tax=Streptomyces sp. AC154 TaxID=3143184 RepID=UPI003F80FDAA